MVIFDFDQTLVDTSPVEALRKARRWSDVMARLDRLHPYNGIGELLAQLHAAGHPLAIVTRSPDMVAKAIVKGEGWPIDIIIGFHAVSRRKPDPEGLLLAMQRGGAAPADSFHVGDNPEDTEAARGAGVVAIGTSWGISDPSALIASKPDYHFETVAELRRFFAGR